MPLIDLKTDLKSLKYGLDRRGRGSSREPFITKTIPEGDTPGATRDVLLRQGTIQSGIDDTSRLTQLLFSTTRGLTFTSNQNLLSRLSVKTEASLGPAYGGGAVNQGIYLPTSTIAQAPVNALGTHLNLLGLNPSSPIAGVTEGGLFQGIGGLIRYEQAAKDFNQVGLNRLVGLKRNKIDLLPNSTELLSYGGGPGAPVGIGRTTIKRTSNTTGINPYGNPIGGYKLLSKTQVSLSKTSLDLNNLLGVSNQLIPNSGLNNVLGFAVNPNTQTFGAKSNNKTVTLRTAYNKGTNASSIQKYNPNPKYTTTSFKAGSDISEDKFNKLNTELLNNSEIREETPDSQLFKFYLNLINANNPGTNQYLYWQAYIDTFNDQIGADYDPYNYVGRGYPLYKYKGFKRSIGLDFTIVAHTPTQILPIYQKLNSLIQNMAPNYSGAGYLRGNFVKLTIGDYLDNVPGIVTGFSLNPIFEAGFELSSGRQLPKAIKVSGFNFTPIADNDNGLIKSDSNFILNKISSLRGAADVDPTLGDPGTELDISDFDNFA
tara:strand:- start:85 stop:1713 length:1629 start_codon:yes stop_codon:yes gene_type:complete